ncbi:Alpha/Beta hydrolase protein [Chytridium lagenaria]|nr:Alpha/Beta hydrolase protein [Chytridium lagenaria]
MTGNITGTILREDIDDILHYARFAEIVYATDEIHSIFDGTGGRLLRHNISNQLFLSPYFIVYDPDTDSIIIAIRGTFSIADVLVDLKFDLAEFDIPELEDTKGGHWAHSGMLRTARNIVADVEKEDVLRPVLTDPESDYFGCPLVVTGHSLGAGVAALVASLLRAQYPTACCYAYEPPGCLLSSRAAKHFESFCTSVVMGDDIVPRTSRNSLEFLKSDLARLIGSCDVPKWRVFQSLLKESKKKGDEEEDVEKGRIPKTPRELLDRLMARKAGDEDEEMLRRAVEHFIERDDAFKVERVVQFTPMFVPGRILYIEKHRRPPQTFPQAIGVAFNAAGRRLLMG